MELNENPRTGDFLLSEANGTLSRENAILDTGALVAGQVLGKITASGKYVILAPGASDGSQNAAAILWDGADATAADAAIVVIARTAEVKADALVWPVGITSPQKTTAIGQLNQLDIVLR
jgi:hypothetical protein